MRRPDPPKPGLALTEHAPCQQRRNERAAPSQGHLARVIATKWSSGSLGANPSD